MEHPQDASGSRDATPSARELSAAHPEVSTPATTVESLVRSTLHESAIAATNYIAGIVNGSREPNGVVLKAAIYLVERVAPSTSGERDKDSWAEWSKQLTMPAPIPRGTPTGPKTRAPRSTTRPLAPDEPYIE